MYRATVTLLAALVCCRFVGADMVSHVTHMKDTVSIRDVVIEGDSVWVGTRASGLILYGMNSRAVHRYSGLDSGLPSDSVRGIAVDSQRKKRWVATARGLVQIDAEGCRVHELPEAAGSSPRIADVAFDGSGTGWIALYDEGVFAFRDELWHDVLEENPGFPMELAGNHAQALLPGCGDEMWFGYGGWFRSHGLARLSNGRWFTLYDKSFCAATPGPDCNLYALRGGALFGSDDQAVVKIVGTELRHRELPDIHPGLARAYALAVGPDLTLWILGSDNTLFCLKDTLCDSLAVPDSCELRPSIVSSGAGGVVASARHINGTHGLAAFTNGAWRFHSLIESSIPSNYLRGLGIDRHDNVWISHENRMSVYRDSSWQTISVADAGNQDFLPGTIWFDAHGAAWASTEDREVRVSDSTVSSVSLGAVDERLPGPFTNPVVGNKYGEIAHISSAEPRYSRNVPQNAMAFSVARPQGDEWTTNVCECTLPHRPKPVVTGAAMDSAGAVWLHIGGMELKRIAPDDSCSDIPVAGIEAGMMRYRLIGISTCAGNVVYVGTDDSAILRVGPEGQELIPFGRPVEIYSENQLVLLGCDNSGRLWFDLQTPYKGNPRGGNVGLCVLDGDTCIMGVYRGLGALTVAATDSHGDMWAATERNGLFVLHGVDSGGSEPAGNYVSGRNRPRENGVPAMFDRRDGTLLLDLERREHVRVRACNVQGRILGTADKYVPAGKHRLRIHGLSGQVGGVILISVIRRSGSEHLLVP